MRAIRALAVVGGLAISVPAFAQGIPVYDSSTFLQTLSTVKNTRSEEHTSELQSLMRISYAVFCLKKKNNSLHTRRPQTIHRTTNTSINCICFTRIYNTT